MNLIEYRIVKQDSFNMKRCNTGLNNFKNKINQSNFLNFHISVEYNKNQNTEYEIIMIKSPFYIVSLIDKLCRECDGDYYTVFDNINNEMPTVVYMRDNNCYYCDYSDIGVDYTLNNCENIYGKDNEYYNELYNEGLLGFEE